MYLFSKRPNRNQKKGSKSKGMKRALKVAKIVYIAISMFLLLVALMSIYIGIEPPSMNFCGVTLFLSITSLGLMIDI